MPRPRKGRRVCNLPENDVFGPLNKLSTDIEIYMTIEEYESIRLMDLEMMTQEECAERMGVARTTVQRIYSDARKKLALALVEGKALKIEGGDYQLCNEGNSISNCRHCRGNRFGRR